MRPTSKAAETYGINKKNKVDWDRVREIIKLIQRAGGEVVNRHKMPRTFKLPKRPGIQLLGYGDYLNRAGFMRQYSEEEIQEIEDLRIGGARF